MSQFTITVEGVEALEKKLGGVMEPIGGIVREAGIFAREKTAEYSKPHAADTGALGRNITLKLGAGAVPLEATIVPYRAIAGLAAKVEEGGAHRVPAKPLALWARRHGYIGPKQSVGPILLAIRQSGTKGVKMFEHAAKDTEAKVKELVSAAVSAIERRWGS
jgi:hypothetical protein